MYAVEAMKVLEVNVKIKGATGQCSRISHSSTLDRDVLKEDVLIISSWALEHSFFFHSHPRAVYDQL